MCYGMHCEYENSWGECEAPTYIPCPLELAELEGQETDEQDELEEDEEEEE